MFVSSSLGSCVVEVSSLTPIKHSAGFVSASRFHSSVGVIASGMSPELHDGRLRSPATCNTTVRCDGFTLHFSTPTEQSAVEVIVLQRSSAIRSVFGLMSRPRKRVLLCSSPSRKSAVATGPILHVVGPCACRQRWHRHPDRVPLIWLASLAGGSNVSKATGARGFLGQEQAATLFSDSGCFCCLLSVNQ